MKDSTTKKKAAGPATKAETKPDGKPTAGNGERAQSGPPIVVGLGASAGGLEAVQRLLETMPPDTGMAFVHIQHLDPAHKSLMAELLRTSTKMQVVEATDQTVIAPNTVYISPPDRDVAIFHGKLHLVQPAEPHRLPIDFFFRSLARDQGDKSIAVVLSGTGTDGTLGVRAVKGAGGLVVVQDPRSAKYDGMPRSAIGTHLVDHAVAVEEMPRVLLGYVRHPYVTSPDSVAPTMAGQLEQIFVLLREQTGHDFAHEELETSKEELQSVNEQLMTVNNELQEKLEELWQANNDLTNPLNTEIGTIFLDNDLRIERFTPAVTKLVQVNQASYTMFHARKEDILGARLSDLVSGRWDRGDLRKRLDTVIAGGAPLDGFEVVQDLPKLGRRTLKLYATRTAFGGKAVAGEEELTFLTIEDATGAKAREARGNGDGEARGG